VAVRRDDGDEGDGVRFRQKEAWTMGVVFEGVEGARGLGLRMSWV